MNRTCENCVKRDVCPDFNDPSSDEPCDSFLEQRPHGEWLNIEDTYCVCSNCRWENEHWQTRFVACPCCGADMRPKEGDKK